MTSDPGAPRLSVVMVNYNTTALAVDSLQSLRRVVGNDGIEVIFVDNASRGFDPEPVLAAWPEARIVASDENLGFGRGNNLGADAASGEYLWLLNTDTLIPDDNGLWSMVAFLDDHPGYAAVSPLLTDDEGAVQPWQTAYFPSLWRMVLSPPARLMGRLAPALRPALGVIDTNLRPHAAADVDQAVAAALIVRRRAFAGVGGFSPEYFFFLEDTDLCRKLHMEGWRIRWQPAAHIIHLWGRSVSDPVARQRMFFSAQDRYFGRWHRPISLAILRMLRAPLLLGTRLRRRSAGARRQPDGVDRS